MTAFVEDEAFPRALVLVGGAGVGKSTLWEAGVAAAKRHGVRVLVARPSGAEAGLSFAGLIDLYEGIDVQALAGVPVPQRSALEVALLRAAPRGAPAQPQAIALGVLNGLRALAARGPVLVAIDDLQWLDPPSAEALAFGARRFGRQRVGFLLATRPGRRSALERAFNQDTLKHLEIGPLSLGAIRRLLSERLALTLSRDLLRRIMESTLGNPLFALELGRVLVEHGVPELGEDIPVPDTVEELLGTRVARLAGPARRLLLAVALSGELQLAEAARIADSAAVEDAVDAGVLAVDDDRVRVSHPLLAAVAKKRSRPRELRELHLALAEVVADEELRARHLALATVRPDPQLAATLSSAASGAFARGARGDAVQLAEHALRLTPRESAQRSERLLSLAGYLETAGETRRLTDLLEPELASLPAGVVRARGWLLLSEGGSVRTVAEFRRYLDSALAESRGDPAVRAHVLARKADDAAGSVVENIPQATAWALEALAAAPGAGRDVELVALRGLSWARSMSGRPIDDLCERFRAASGGAAYVAESPERIAAQRLVWRGEVDQARVVLTRLLALADEHGEATSYAVLRLHVCELELRIGGWDAAARLLDEWSESAERDLLLPPMYERCRALLAAGRGIPGEAEQWAAQAISAAEASGFGWDRLEGLRALGIAALLAHEPARAAESLRAVWEHTLREGVDEPGVFPVAPELVEALAELGELDQARGVTGRLKDLSERQRHPWGLVTAMRCDAIIRLAFDGDDRGAAAALGQVAGEYGRLSLCFDRARSLLSLGRAQRRLRQWAAARSSLQGAASAFEELGSVGWVAQARSELARVGARRPAPSGELTASERRVVELAACGNSNKQIARELYVTVHTVEAHLSHAYAKLGVRSRGQLAGRLSPTPSDVKD